MNTPTVIPDPNTDAPIMPFATGGSNSCEYTSLPTSASCSQLSGGRCDAVSSDSNTRRICPCTANNANTKKSNSKSLRQRVRE